MSRDRANAPAGSIPRATARIVAYGGVIVALSMSVRVEAAHAIPAFARRYRTTCSSCHTAAPKLNAVGEAFRLHGYRLPQFDEAAARDRPLPLGDDAWRELWPRGIWPGEITSTAPISLRVQADVVANSASRAPAGVHFKLPHEVYLLGGASLGDGLAIFAELGVSPGESLEIAQAKIAFLDVVPKLPRGAVNLWLGRLNPYLFVFADRQVDRAAVLTFGWQSHRVGDVRPAVGDGSAPLTSPNAARLGGSVSGFEMNGVLGGRTHYGIGIAQGASDGEEDNNRHKDLYYKIRHKWGGLRLDGAYDAGGAPPPGGDGQSFDRSVILEHFGYVGAEPGALGVADRYQAFGAALRVVYDRLDIGVGVVTRRDEDPWGLGAAADMRSVFGRTEWMIWPWLFGSVKAEHFTTSSADARRLGFVQGGEDRLLVAPGLIALVRQNVRLILEGEAYARERSTQVGGQPRRAALTARLDVAF